MSSYTQKNVFILVLTAMVRLFYDIAAHEYGETDEDGLTKYKE